MHTFPMLLPDPIWTPLAEAIASEAKIASSRNTPENLKRLYEAQRCAILVHEGAPVGFIAIWPVGDGMSELGSIWVNPDCRGMGFTIKLYHAIKQLIPLVGDQVFEITTNPIIVKVGGRVGLIPLNDWGDPIPFELTCGVCEDVTCPTARNNCALRNTTCHLRIFG